VVHDVLEQLEVFLDDRRALVDVAVAVLQVKCLLQRHVQLVQRLVLPRDVGRVEDVEVLGDLVLDFQHVPNEHLELSARDFKRPMCLERVDVLARFAQQLVRIGKQDGKRQLLAAFADVQRVANLDCDDGVHRLQNRLAKVQPFRSHRFHILA